MEKNRTLKEASVINVTIHNDYEGNPFKPASYILRSRADVNLIVDYVDKAIYDNLTIPQVNKWVREEFNGRCTLDVKYGEVDRPTLNIIIKQTIETRLRLFDITISCLRADNETST